MNKVIYLAFFAALVVTVIGIVTVDGSRKSDQLFKNNNKIYPVQDSRSNKEKDGRKRKEIAKIAIQQFSKNKNKRDQSKKELK